MKSENLDTYLGVRKYTFGMAEKQNQVGQVTGLAWTEVGGELLTIETVTMPGKGKTITTGKLNAVSSAIDESLQQAAPAPAPVPKACSIDNPDCEACQ